MRKARWTRQREALVSPRREADVTPRAPFEAGDRGREMGLGRWRGPPIMGAVKDRRAIGKH